MEQKICSISLDFRAPRHLIWIICLNSRNQPTEIHSPSHTHRQSQLGAGSTPNPPRAHRPPPSGYRWNRSNKRHLVSVGVPLEPAPPVEFLSSFSLFLFSPSFSLSFPFSLLFCGALRSVQSGWWCVMVGWIEGRVGVVQPDVGECCRSGYLWRCTPVHFKY